MIKQLTAMLIVTALAFGSIASTASAKQKRHHKHHRNAQSIQPGWVGALTVNQDNTVHVGSQKFPLKKSAVLQNVGKTQAAITNSAWPHAAKDASRPLPDILARLMLGAAPDSIRGITITRKDFAGRAKGSNIYNLEGSWTSPEGFVFCFQALYAYANEPWYIVRFAIKICDQPEPAPTPVPPTPTPTPHTPTPTPTPHTPTPTPTPHTPTPTPHTPTPTATPHIPTPTPPPRITPTPTPHHRPTPTPTPPATPTA